MKLWLISQSKDTGYDYFDSAVVAAETEEEAKLMHPQDGKDIRTRVQVVQTWTYSPEDVDCQYLGEAKGGTQKEVICSSYNGS